ncbi:unnamed protein product [Schistosoma spindalis]|nr:unnamed protein product [Schistosoma spindale]
MWPLILQFIRTNVRYVALPFAVIVGSIGFKAESWFRSQEAISSSMHNPKQTTSEARRKRQLTKDLNTPAFGQKEYKDVEFNFWTYLGLSTSSEHHKIFQSY